MERVVNEWVKGKAEIVSLHHINVYYMNRRPWTSPTTTASSWADWV